MKPYALIASCAILAWSQAQASPIYRCEIDGTVVFSDRPCSEDAKVHDSENLMSIVPPAGDIDQVAAANRAFIDQRRAEQATDRENRAAARRRAEAEAERAEVRQIGPVLPWLGIPVPVEPDVPEPPRESRDRDQNFSALSGPLPGTRRR